MLQYVPLLIIPCVLVLLILYGVTYFHTMRPKSGTLEWIAGYDRPSRSLTGCGYPLERTDFLLLSVLCLLTAFFWGVGAVIPLPLRPLPNLLLTIFEDCAAPAIAAAFAFASFKRLFGRTGTACLTALLVALDLAAEPAALVFPAAAFYGLTRFLTAREDASFRELFPHLAGTFAVLAVGCYYDAAALLLTAAALGLTAAGCIIRFIHHNLKNLILYLLAALLIWSITSLLLYIPAGLALGLTFPGMLLRPEFYQLILQRLDFYFMPLVWLPLNLIRLQYDWVLILFGLLAFIITLTDLFRRRDHRCALLAVWFLAQTAAMAGMGSHGLSFSCAAGLCYIWSNFLLRDRAWPVSLGAGCLIGFQLVRYSMIWLT